MLISVKAPQNINASSSSSCGIRIPPCCLERLDCKGWEARGTVLIVCFCLRESSKVHYVPVPVVHFITAGDVISTMENLTHISWGHAGHKGYFRQCWLGATISSSGLGFRYDGICLQKFQGSHHICIRPQVPQLVPRYGTSEQCLDIFVLHLQHLSRGRKPCHSSGVR